MRRLGLVACLVLGLITSSYAQNIHKTTHASALKSKKKCNKKYKHCAKVRIKHKKHSKNYMRGTASYYAPKFAGRKTATGTRLSMESFTAAHPTLPMGTHLKVTNLNNGKSVYVVVNDRMPKKSGHVIDLTNAGAKYLGIIHGVAKVELQKISQTEFIHELKQQKLKIREKMGLITESQSPAEIGISAESNIESRE